MDKPVNTVIYVAAKKGKGNYPILYPCNTLNEPGNCPEYFIKKDDTYESVGYFSNFITEKVIETDDKGNPDKYGNFTEEKTGIANFIPITEIANLDKPVIVESDKPKFTEIDVLKNEIFHKSDCIACNATRAVGGKRTKRRKTKLTKRSKKSKRKSRKNRKKTMRRRR